ncbi:hypothetical protein V1286_004097 [Bradyrhizobium algeriense]|uniref:Uncharacterized protein n=1 Tax=Bradyrhizobium algeriense TaxID=634784 RepID=A0ABU8BEY4_9BRAD
MKFSTGCAFGQQAESGTEIAAGRSPKKWLDVDMTEPLPLLIESSIEIAWDYLARTGELDDAMVAGRFLSDTIELMVRRGERRRLMLANKAISAYQQFRRQQSHHPVLASA